MNLRNSINRIINFLSNILKILFSEKLRLSWKKFTSSFSNNIKKYFSIFSISFYNFLLKTRKKFLPLAKKAGFFIKKIFRQVVNYATLSGGRVKPFFVIIWKINGPLLIKYFSIAKNFTQNFFKKIKIFFETSQIGQGIKKILSWELKLLKDVYFFLYKKFWRLGDFSGEKPFVYYSLVSVFNIILIILISYQVLFAKHSWEGGSEKKFYIRKGQTLEEISEDLKENDIIKSKFLFKITAKIRASEEKINIGYFAFKNGISNAEVLSVLVGKPTIIKFTVPEGWTLKQIGKLAESKLNLSTDLFLKESENDSLINLLGIKDRVKNLEGFLYPDTYFLSNDIDEKSLVNLLVNEFLKKTRKDANFNQILSSKNLNLFDVTILASIVQAETSINDEMPLIAGVYFNRLKIKMKLQADPTLQYVIPGGPKRLRKEDLRYNSPYNTYIHLGLPPGPINNPGFNALTAVLNPKETNYFYFVATGKGGHKFSSTLQEHDKAVQEYRKNK